jgi:hypothetical protein
MNIHNISAVWDVKYRKCKGTNNRSSKPGRPIEQNLTGCLQRYVVPGNEENKNISIWNINNMVLRIIPRDHNLIFISEQEKCGDQMWDVPVGLSCRSLVARIISLLGNWIFNEDISNISKLSWMKRINNDFISLIPVGYRPDRRRKRYWDFGLRKRTSLLACCKFWWTEQAYRGPPSIISRQPKATWAKPARLSSVRLSCTFSRQAIGLPLTFERPSSLHMTFHLLRSILSERMIGPHRNSTRKMPFWLQNQLLSGTSRDSHAA